MPNQFVWADLSTFDLAAAKRFYSRVLGWGYADLGEGYWLCQARDQTSAGLFTMPTRFQKIGLPSFWMSYVQVRGLGQLVERAQQLGARVEGKPAPAPGGGHYALLRDPIGAGFTCYEGSALDGRGGPGDAGRLVWNELTISNLDTVAPFYTALFDWSFEPVEGTGRYHLRSAAGELRAGVQVVSNTIKGDKEYWGVYFAVPDLRAASEAIQEAGGQLGPSFALADRAALLAYDPQGAAFHLVD